MNLRVVIVEDEKHSRETLKNLLMEFCENIDIVGFGGTVSEAVETIRKSFPDLVFMDIELQTGTGFDVLKELENLNFEVIFTTAFEHYAIKAIKFSSIDYLLKPIDIEELQNAVEKARERKDIKERTQQLQLLMKNIGNIPSDKKKICLATSGGLEFINLQDIIFCEADGSYTNFYIAPDKRLTVSKNLKEYEYLLVDHNFMRVHNSYLINLFEVKRFVKSDGGYILMNNEKQVSISQNKREEFLERMTML
ncbi:response regulator [Fulvivirga imtechensis AK7]|uniref:Response regulator n=1 Tax=Fulvivirga imtechensis AK7 TaxID=1237149 RepID=L8JVR3_9BACT|nr:LytTR family DNA-binding domain-containing protein [Fulvivirga imtechensis]ELR71317.1 response regulator [Fulvivirga imtechensis AK7]